MTNELKVLTIQFEPKIAKKEKNLELIEKFLQNNADFNADLVVLPELWNTGCVYEKCETEAEFIPYNTTNFLSNLAEKFNANIISGSIMERTSDNHFYNTSVVINRSGDIIAQYRKKHLFSHFGNREKEFFEAGKENCVVNIEGIKFGLAICYDIRFPEQFREMVKQGAEVFAIPAAFDKTRLEQWNILNQARALENLAIIISCNQFGASNIVSPYGKILRTSKAGNKAIRNIVNIEEVRQARKLTPFLDDII